MTHGVFIDGSADQDVEMARDKGFIYLQFSSDELHLYDNNSHKIVDEDVLHTLTNSRCSSQFTSIHDALKPPTRLCCSTSS